MKAPIHPSQEERDAFEEYDKEAKVRPPCPARRAAPRSAPPPAPHPPPPALFFFNDTASPEIYTSLFGGSVRFV